MMSRVKALEFDGLEVFSASMNRERLGLGDLVTRFITMNIRTVEVVGYEAMQSSDSNFHCVTIVLFYRLRPGCRVQEVRHVKAIPPVSKVGEPRRAAAG